MSEASSIIPGRSCGTCTMCCKVYPVPEMNKPRNLWCKECKPGSGCGIWQNRPQVCRDFHCLWLRDGQLGPEWKPEIAKFVMVWANRDVLNLTVDPQVPLAYRREPYFARLREIARTFLPKGQHIVIYKGESKYLLLPDGEHLLGNRDEELAWRVKIKTSGSGQSYEIEFQKNQAVAVA